VGNSSISLESVYDALASKGIPDPRMGASGYGDTMALEIANQVIADLICERYNWKWNSAVANPFQTNSYQQDYPQLAQTRGPIGWGENLVIVDINNTQMPKPLWSTPQVTWVRELPPTSANLSAWRPGKVCWMYNKNLQLGEWPGANVTYYPLITTNAQGQNPLMNFLDKNGNILIVTGFGITGATAPFAVAGANEGITVSDGSVTWTVVSPTSQGFRINTLPSATGPSFQVTPTYQLDPPRFSDFEQLLDPIPNSFSRYFYRGLESECYISSTNPGDLKRGQNAKVEWLNALTSAFKQGDRELNSYSLLPASYPVEERWQGGGAITADNPWGTN
jgi:hypothetical protein